MKKIFLMTLFLTLIFPAHLALADTPQKGGNLMVCQPAEPPGLDPTANTAAAIDRVVHHSLIIEFGKEMTSYRAQQAAERNRVQERNNDATAG